MCQEQWSVETETSSWSQVCVCIGLHWNYQHLSPPNCLIGFNINAINAIASILWHFEAAYCPAIAANQDSPSLGLTGGPVAAPCTTSGDKNTRRKW